MTKFTKSETIQKLIDEHDRLQPQGTYRQLHELYFVDLRVAGSKHAKFDNEVADVLDKSPSIRDGLVALKEKYKDE